MGADEPKETPMQSSDKKVSRSGYDIAPLQRAQVELPPLEQYEKRPSPNAPQSNIIVLPSLNEAGKATAVAGNEPTASPANTMQEAV